MKTKETISLSYLQKAFAISKHKNVLQNNVEKIQIKVTQNK